MRRPILSMMLRWPLAGMVLSMTVVAQRTITVPGNAATIQGAIAIAQNRDTIVVAPGVYRERIDYQGKAIRITSRDGAPTVRIVGGVRFAAGETNRSVLDGVTVEGGSRGIEIAQASPFVRFCVVTKNTLSLGTLVGGHVSGGAGIRCVSPVGQPAILLGNRIVDNHVSFPLAVFNGHLDGGGVYCENAILMANFVTGNSATQQLTSSSLSGGGVHGGGIAARGSLVVDNVIASNSCLARMRSLPVDGGGLWVESCRVINNTVVGNTLTNNQISAPGPSRGAGIYVETLFNRPSTIANTIVWQNTANQAPSSIAASWGWPAPRLDRNFFLAPGFVVPGDYHLSATSPCIDTGSPNYLNFSAADFDSSARGAGAGVDIGADEFAPHAYHVGRARVAQPIPFRVTGPPTAPAFLGFSAARHVQPIPIPGLGLLHLDLRWIVVTPLGTIPASGFLTRVLTLPLGAPLGRIPVQALVGSRLTQLHVMVLEP